MRLLSRLFFNLYILFAIFFIFLPLSLISRIIGYVKKGIKRNVDTYFTDTKYSSPHYVNCNKIRCSSVLAYLSAVVFKPCLLLRRYIEKNLFKPAIPKFNATPNQAAAIVISQILGNLRGIKEDSCDLNAEYIFALQPTLMDTGSNAPNDEVFLKKRRKEKVWGFSYAVFFQVYYDKLRQAINKDNKIRNNFLDTSKIFVGNTKQRFVDTCHIGDIGQNELAGIIAKEILKKAK